MDLNFTDQRAIVCGSTQGIGKAIAVELAELGASITLIARNKTRLEKTLKELPAGEHDYLCVDFNEPEQLRDCLNGYLTEEKKVQILVNNTGGPAPGSIYFATLHEFQQALSRHLYCNHILAQAVVPGMKKLNYGRIVNIISISVKEPIPGLGVSNTTRAAVASWAKTLAGELGQFGITVNNLLPGYTATDRLRSLLKDKASQSKKSADEIAEKICQTIPAGRFAKPEETAAAVAFLASPAASYINGINLPVDGGRTASL